MTKKEIIMDLMQDGRERTPDDIYIKTNINKSTLREALTILVGSGDLKVENVHGVRVFSRNT